MRPVRAERAACNVRWNAEGGLKPQLEGEKLLNELADITRRWDEVRLQRELGRAERIEMPEPLRHACLHQLNSRLGRWDEALTHANWLANTAPSLTAFNNVGVALIHLRRFEEAAECLVAAAVAPDGATYVGLHANLAEAFAGMGAWPAANATFEHAEALADANNADDMFRLSDAAACVGRYHRAVELFARFVELRAGLRRSPEVAPLDFIEANEALLEDVEVSDALAEAAVRVAARRDGAKVVPIEGVDVSDDEAIATLEAFRPLRVRANRAVLSDA